MGEIFNQEYYQVGDEEEKPEFPFDPEIDDGAKYKISFEIINLSSIV